MLVKAFKMRVHCKQSKRHKKHAHGDTSWALHPSPRAPADLCCWLSCWATSAARHVSMRKGALKQLASMLLCCQVPGIRPALHAAALIVCLAQLTAGAACCCRFAMLTSRALTKLLEASCCHWQGPPPRPGLGGGQCGCPGSGRWPGRALWPPAHHRGHHLLGGGR